MVIDEDCNAIVQGTEVFILYEEGYQYQGDFYVDYIQPVNYVVPIEGDIDQPDGSISWMTVGPDYVPEEPEEEYGEIYEYDQDFEDDEYEWYDEDDMYLEDKEPDNNDYEWIMDEGKAVWDETFGDYARITNIIPTLMALGLLTVNS